MSYCRFSSEDFSSDVYCYADCSGGFTTHVASNRIIGDIPKSEHLFIKNKLDEYMVAHKKQMKFLETAKREKIGLEFDGETFNDETALAAAERLESLKEIGYNVPDNAIKWLREEDN